MHKTRALSNIMITMDSRRLTYATEKMLLKIELSGRGAVLLHCPEDLHQSFVKECGPESSSSLHRGVAGDNGSDEYLDSLGHNLFFSSLSVPVFSIELIWNMPVAQFKPLRYSRGGGIFHGRTYLRTTVVAGKDDDIMGSHISLLSDLVRKNGIREMM